MSRLKPSKTLITLRLDPDVIAWFRERHPVGCQTAMNAALKAHVALTEEGVAHAATRDPTGAGGPT